MYIVLNTNMRMYISIYEYLNTMYTVYYIAHVPIQSSAT